MPILLTFIEQLHNNGVILSKYVPGAQLIAMLGMSRDSFILTVSIITLVAWFLIHRYLVFLHLVKLARELALLPVPELRDNLRSPKCLIPNLILLELHRRGEEIRSELPLVVDLLVAEEPYRRRMGLAALNSAFPELSALIPDYNVNDSIDELRRKTIKLREACEQPAGRDRSNDLGSNNA